MRKYEREPHVGDDAELVVEPLDDVVGQRVAPALPRRPPKVRWREVVGVVGEARRAAGRRAAAACRTRSRRRPARRSSSVLSHASGTSREQVAHLGRRLQVVLVAVELEAVRVAHERAGLHAQQGVVGDGVVAVGVVAVVGGQQRRPDACGRSRAAAGWCGAARRGRGPAARRRGCRARRCPGAGPAFASGARPRRPAAAPGARGRRGSPVVAMTPSRWSARAAPSRAGACSSSPRGRPGSRAGSGCGSRRRSRPAGSGGSRASRRRRRRRRCRRPGPGAAGRSWRLSPAM